MRQCSACNTEAELELHSSLLQLGSFTDWLQQHAGLVRSISTHASYLPHGTDVIQGLQKEVHYMTAVWLLRQALQLAALPPANEGPAALAVTAAGLQTPQQQQQQQGLRLASFSSSLDEPGAIGVLAALPAASHSLTHLDLSMPCSNADYMDAAALAAVLARLSNLQHLELDKGEGKRMKGSCIAAIKQLTRLTYLLLESEDWLSPEADLRQLLAQPPPLRHLVLKGHYGRCSIYPT